MSLDDAKDKKLGMLEERIDKLDENIRFLQDLLSHIKSQFDEFKRDIENKVK